MMNLIDLALLIGVIACAGWGAKRGFVRMIMITLGLCAAIVVAVHYNDSFTRELAGYFHASPLWVSMWAFLIASMLLFALFRLGAKVFFRVANVQKLGKHDQFGGAFVGLIFGWVMMGYLVFLSMFLPLPYTIEERFENTVLAMKMGASVPFLYETTAKLHPSQSSFIDKMELTLDEALVIAEKNKSGRRRATKSGVTDQTRVDDFLDRIERYFASEEY
ncbi:MAG TPA: CvpA family protein [bacterium]|nr:CvpA family protein [bacterium]